MQMQYNPIPPSVQRVASFEPVDAPAECPRHDAPRPFDLYDVMRGVRDDGWLARLKPLELSVFWVYFSRADNDTGRAWPSLRSVADSHEHASTSHVAKARKGLVDHGLLVATGERSSCGTAVYAVRLPAAPAARPARQEVAVEQPALAVEAVPKGGYARIRRRPKSGAGVRRNPARGVRPNPAYKLPIELPKNHEGARRSPRGPGGGSDHQRLIDHFTAGWADRHGGAAYPFDGGRDAKAAKRVLEAVGRDLVRGKAIVDRYLDDDDSFAQKRGQPLHHLANELPQYVAGGGGGRDPDGWPERDGAAMPTAAMLAALCCDDGGLQ